MRRLRRFWRWQLADRAPRPYVAFAAMNQAQARRLYRTQNLIWVWLGLAAALSGVAYAFRPDLGPVLVTHRPVIDTLREALFAPGGVLIALGVWRIRRVLEVAGHILFASGALITAAATATLPGPQGVQVATTFGVAAASAFRVYYIVRWIGSADAPRGG